MLLVVNRVEGFLLPNPPCPPCPIGYNINATGHDMNHEKE